MKNTGENTNARFGFTQSTKKQPYFDKVFSNFLPLCKANTTSYTKLFVTNSTTLSSLNFTTMRLPCLNPYFELFYSHGKRNVPMNITNLLTPIGLSYWIIDDGSKQNKGIHLNVYAFNREDVDRLLETLRTKYGFICTIHYHKSGPRIYIHEESMPALRATVSQYIVPSMYYKVGMLYYSQSCSLIYYLTMQFYVLFLINF